jgi:putative OPT family oligopeptide transporter
MASTPHKPFVPASATLSEFTLRALLLGLVMSVVLGAANAYLGLRAGMTIAATYPAAVISMAVLRLFRGNVLEENFSRTVGSIGESVAAGAIFTLPAFVILRLWTFDTLRDYLLASALMIVGGILGVLFVTILRRVMVEDPDLQFPESVAASEIHKAGQTGADAARQLFAAMGVGGAIQLLAQLKVFNASKDFVLNVGEMGRSFVRLGFRQEDFRVAAGGVSTMSAPAVSPAYVGVGYIIGPVLGSLNFAGGLLAWGLFVPLLAFFLGPTIMDSFSTQYQLEPGSEAAWALLSDRMWRYIVRPIAVGGMLVGASFTLWRMRNNLIAGLKRSVADLQKSAAAKAATERTELDLSFRTVLIGIVAVFLLMIALYYYFTGQMVGAVFAAVVMLIAGFFFAAVSGNLVGMIGSSNNPVSGLTLATLIIAALVMVIIGVKGDAGVAAVLGVAAVVCVSSAVAGEMLQDLKVGHILGGTPWKMQVGDLIGVVVSGALLFFPLYVLHAANVAGGGSGFGDRQLSAPQAGLMATLAQGIVGGEMAWPLVVVGIAMGISLILIKVRSPMLFAVGMYLPLETTFAIFVGGMLRGWVDSRTAKRKYNDAQKARVENTGVLVASGLIAGEALVGLIAATVVFYRTRVGQPAEFPNLATFAPGFGTWYMESVAGPMALLFAVLMAAYLIFRPLSKAGSPDEPAPPTAVM